MDFIKKRMLAGFDQVRLAAYLEVAPKTVRNWDTGKTQPPKAVIKLLEILSNDLEFLGSEWQGFRFHKGEIITPERDYLRPSDLRAHNWIVQSLEFRQKHEKKKRLQVGVINLEKSQNETKGSRFYKT